MKRTIIVAVLATSLVLAGCGGPGEAPDDDGGGEGEEPADDPGGGEDENAEDEDEGAFVTGTTIDSASIVT